MGRIGEGEEDSLGTQYLIATERGFWYVDKQEYIRLTEHLAVGEPLDSCDFVSFTTIAGVPITCRVGAICNLSMLTKEARYRIFTISELMNAEDKEFEGEWKLTNPEVPE